MTQTNDGEMMADLDKTQLALDFGDFVYEVVRMASSEECGNATYLEKLTASRKAIFSKFGLGLLCYFESLLNAGGHEVGVRHDEIIGALVDVCESLDYLAAKSDDEATSSLHERMIVFRALEADYMANGQPLNIQEMDAALARFKRIAGLA